MFLKKDAFLGFFSVYIYLHDYCICSSHKSKKGELCGNSNQKLRIKLLKVHQNILLY